MRDFLDELRQADSASAAVGTLLKYRGQTLKLAVLAVALLAMVLLYMHQTSAQLTISEADGGESAAAAASRAAEDAAGAGNGSAGGGGENAQAVSPVDSDGIVYVDIGGAVKHPMLAELPTGSRVEDAIEAAGGLTKKADMSGVNRAQVLTDGEKVYIPAAGEDADSLSGQASAGASSAGRGSGGTQSDSAAGSAAEASGISGGLININTADAVLLQQLTGVGPVTAQKIVDYREQNGKFSSVDELKNVSGIGEKTFEKMQFDVTI